MKKILFLVISIVLGSFSSFATTILRVGPSETYTKIRDAYNVCIDPDDYIIEIQNDYTLANAGESGGIDLTGKANKDAVNTITIRPASGASLSFSSTAAYIFRLYGAKWVIFDGRAGGVGSSAWTLLNTNNGAGSRVFTFENGANNVVIKNCLIKGDNSASNGATAGLIYFGNVPTATTGNNDNLIENCTFSEHIGFLKVYIQSNGSATTKRNKNNTISNCSFVNFRASAISIMSNSEAFTISNNHFYRTSTASSPVTDLTAIFISYSGYSGHVISGNYIGGQAPYCGGSSFNFSDYSFRGIHVGSSSTGTNTITNNTISNINLSTNRAGSIANPVFCGIYTVGNTTNTIIGSAGNGNTIGSTTGTGNIIINYSGSSPNQPVFSGIHLYSTGTHSVSYNTFGGIDFSSSTTNGSEEIALIRIANNTVTTIDNNTFGNTTANNITITSNSGSLSGIYSDLSYTPTLTISNNTFQNFTINDASGGTNAKLFGIWIEDQLLPTSIYNNEIKDFTNNTLAPSTNSNQWDGNITGIALSHTNTPTGNISVYGNVISDLVSSYNGSTLIYTTGIAVTAANTGTLSIYRNKIKNISNASTNASSGIIGLFISNGSTDSAMVYNNIISLSDGSNTDAKIIRGIVDQFSTGISNIYHNTVKIYSNYSAGTAISSALYLVPNTANYRVKNNIFQNVSTGNGTHYAQNWSSVYGGASNIKNNYNEASTVAKWGVTNIVTNDDWKTAISSSTEVTGTISINSSTGAPASGDVVGIGGTPIASITSDYNLSPRSITTPSIGAFEVIIPLPIKLVDISAACQKSKTSNNTYGATVKWITASETNSDYFIVEGSMDGFIWEIKDTLDGSGTKHDPTNYYFHDDFINPTPENETVVYYRVSQTDFDGIVNTYDILSCKCEANAKIKIHPIPSKESIVINFGDQNNVPNTFQITDMFGHIIEDITVFGEKSNNTSYTLDISKYASGRYIIKINDWKMKEDGVFIKE